MANKQDDNLSLPLIKPFITVAILIALSLIIGLIINEYRRDEQLRELENKICNIKFSDSFLSEIEDLLRNGPKTDDEMKNILYQISDELPSNSHYGTLYFEWSGRLWMREKWKTTETVPRHISIGKLGEWDNLIKTDMCNSARSNNEFMVFRPIITKEGTAGIFVNVYLRY